MKHRVVERTDDEYVVEIQSYFGVFYVHHTIAECSLDDLVKDLGDMGSVEFFQKHSPLSDNVVKRAKYGVG